MAKPQPRLLTVLRQQDVTPNMRRITLGGPGYQGFPADQEGAYIKLFIESERGSGVRTYTVRKQRHEQGEIDVDFVLHGDHGLAAHWATNVRPGEEIKVGGPGPRKTLDPTADWFFVVGDMTALPAISVNLELLPADAQGVAVLEIIDEADRQSLQAPAGLDIQWVVNPHPGEGDSVLAAAAKSVAWRGGAAAAWSATEFETMREMRAYLRGRGIERSRFYVSSYWKYGLSEDQHKVVKRQDAETVDEG